MLLHHVAVAQHNRETLNPVYDSRWLNRNMGNLLLWEHVTLEKLPPMLEIQRNDTLGKPQRWCGRVASFLSTYISPRYTTPMWPRLGILSPHDNPKEWLVFVNDLPRKKEIMRSWFTRGCADTLLRTPYTDFLHDGLSIGRRLHWGCQRIGVSLVASPRMGLQIRSLYEGAKKDAWFSHM